MANKRIQGITIKIGGDTTELGDALKETEKKSQSVRAELKEVGYSLRSNGESAVLWQQKQELLTKAIEESREKVKILEQAQNQIKEKFLKGEIDDGQYRAFQRELENAKSEVNRFGGQLEETENKIKDLKDTTDKTSDSAENLGDELQEAGKQAENSKGGYSVLKGTLANLVADGFKNLTESAKEAREEINQGYETIITKTGASGESLEDFKGIANNVFSSIPVDMDDVGTAVGEINTRFDETGETLEELTEIFLKYARINGSDVNSSIDNVSAAMKAFNVDTSEVLDVLDVLSAVGQKTGINIGTLEGNLVSNSATFKEMGLSIYEAAQLLGQFEKNGVDASTAITGLKKAQQEATAEGKTTTDALNENITAIKNAQTETEALQIATDLFGKRGASAMTQAIREGRFELSELDGNMSAFSGTVSNTFDTIQKEPDKLKVTTNKLKLELASLAEKIMPKIEKGVDLFNKNLPKIVDTGKKLIPVATG
ncbi:MAG: phage tail tape measure protein, partial [Eubacterium sp.]|nr:phage tail tape measure protein [Eubacterium sp.]